MVINASKTESLRAKYDLDIGQLDYKFIKKCEEAKTIENILKVLRSGQEGVYPDLVRYTEERLRSLKPGSALLRTEQPATTIRALDSKTRDELLYDLNTWKDEVSAVDAELKLTSTKQVAADSEPLPPVRGGMQLSTTATESPEPPPQQKPPRIPSYDYAAWDRYDVEAQLKLLDDREAAAAPEQQPERSDPAIDDQPPVEGLGEAERAALALRERQKGNEYFRSGDFSRAAVYYTRSINASPTVEAFNNRAQANLKLGKHGSALMDCGAVLRREPRNVKALLRRGIARKMNRDWIKARADFQRVLHIEPHNRQAQQHLDEVEKAIVGSETKRSKVIIQEVDSIEEESVLTQEVPTVDCRVQEGGNSATQETFQNEALNSDASEVQSECNQSESDNTDKQGIQVPINQQNYSKRRSMLIQEAKTSDSSVERVEINAKCRNQKAKEKTSGVAYERSEEDAISRERETLSLTDPGHSDINDASNSSRIAVDRGFTSSEQRSPAAKVSPRPTLEQIAEVNVRCDLPTPPPPSDGDSGVAPRRWTTFEFLREWRSAVRSAGGLAATAALLRSVAPHRLPELLGAELDPAMLSTVIRCVQEVLLPEEGPQRCRQLLERLTEARRFQLVKLLLDRDDRRRLASIAECLQRSGADTTLLRRRFLD